MKRINKTAIALAAAHLTWGMGTAHAQTNDQGQNVVVVTGQRAALASAQKLKQDADEIVDSVVADDIGKLPDRSVTEVLQRVVGISINRQAGDNERFSVEGAGVNIRGLNYVRSELNGREAFASNGGRSISWGDIPPELMAGVDVYKNPSAEQTEGGISGLVNLRTALPFDFKAQRGALSVEATHSTLRKGKPDPSVSGLFSNRWKTGFGEFGALIDVASSNSSTQTDTFQFEPFFPRTDIEPGRTVWIPKGAQWRTYLYDRKRQGAYGALQWKRENVQSHLTFFQSRYKDSAIEQSIFSSASPYDLQASGDTTYDSKGAFVTGTISDTKNGGIPFSNAGGFNKGESKTTDIAWNLQWKVADDWTLTSDLQRVRSSGEHFSSAVGLGMLMPSENLDLRGSLPTINFTDAQRAFLADPANYYWESTMEHKDKSAGTLKAWKGDARYAFDHPVLRDVRFGVRLTDRDALTVNSDPSYNWAGVTPPWLLGWDIPKLAYLNDPRFTAPHVTQQFNNFFNGEVNVPAVVFPAPIVASNYPASYQELHAYHDDILCPERVAANGGGSCDRWKAASFGGDNPAGTNKQHERTRAFYTQLRFGFDDLKYPIDGNVGLRYVQTRSHSTGYMSYTPSAPFADGTQTTGVPVPYIPAYLSKSDVENKYNNVLPTVNLRIKASDKLQFRVAYGTSMTRPDFSQLQAYTTLSQEIKSSANDETKIVNVTAVNRTGNAQGNPALKPITSKQLDVTAEWYFARSGSLTMALFDKHLKDVIINQTTSVGLPDTTGTLQRFLVTSPVNGAKGIARGGELAYQQYFDNVPDWLKGIGVAANYTYVYSKRSLYNPVYSEYCSGGQNAANVNLNLNGCDIDGRAFGNLPLTQLSKNAYNLAILYDQGPWSARLAYNWRSRYLLSTNTNGTQGSDGTDTNPASPTFGQHNVAWGLPLWADAYGQLDGGVSYKFSENLKFDFQAQNLSDARYSQTMHQGIGDKVRAVFVSGPRYSLRVGYTF
jgi:iron complex outermembrane recepter protein